LIAAFKRVAGAENSGRAQTEKITAQKRLSAEKNTL
jgi:hypothetical protein